jgi:restriction endonuclease EcoRII-like protein
MYALDQLGHSLDTPKPMATDDEVLALLANGFRRRIPPGRAIAARAVGKALGDRDRDIEWIKQNFSALVEQVQADAYEEYKQGERIAGADTIAEVFIGLLGGRSAEDTVTLFGTHFFALDRFFLGLTQGRRPRAGKAFEYLIKELFIRLGYPFTSQPIINGQPDFLLPSLEHFERFAADCIIFTVKRTLRERWRQIVTEGTRGLGFFLATIDEDVAERDLAEMLRTRITLVVPERIIHIRSDYEQAPNVISFEYFFRFYLDPAMDRWRAAGILKDDLLL